MCSPKVLETVREKIQGQPSMSRRNFLKVSGVAAAGLAVAKPVFARPNFQAMGQIVDLSHVFTINPPTYVLDTNPTREDYVTVEANGFYIQHWSFYEHTGTHMDIPAHFVAGAETVDNYPVDLYLSPAVVIDIAARAEENADTELTVEDIQAWESEHGEIPPGALVCMYSGWDARYDDVEAFRNADADGVMHFPGFHGDAAAFLIEERDIHGIAVDTLSLDNGISSTFTTHVTILGAGKYGIENVANLGSIMGSSAYVWAGIPRWEAGSGGPCRVVAMVSESM